MPKQSQKIRVLKRILEKGSVDRIQSIFVMGIFELSARICELEKDGVVFNKTDRSFVSKDLTKGTCKVYSIESLPDAVAEKLGV